MPLELIKNKREDWANVIDHNFELAGKLPIDGAIHVGAVATFMNGTTGNSDCWYLPINGGKLVFLSLWQIATKTNMTRQDLFKLPASLAPSYSIGAILNENSYVTNRHASQNAFTFWSSNVSSDQIDMDTTLIYLHFD